MEDNYKVYIQVDENNCIAAINSSAFLADTTAWIEIDGGAGDRYHHSQGNYLAKGLIDENGCFNYKFIDGVVTERTADEKQAEMSIANNAREVASLKVQLEETDYKIIKCSEYQLAGLELPYDIAALHTERQALRDRINELETTLI